MEALADILGTSPPIEALRANIAGSWDGLRGAAACPPSSSRARRAREGAHWPRPCTAPAHEEKARSSTSTARPFPRRCSKPSSSASSAARSPMRARRKPGLFQTAHRGTSSSTRWASCPRALQAKLLKVLEERTVRRLGSTQSEPVDVWILAATSDDLPRRSATGGSARTSTTAWPSSPLPPPLRERTGDVVRLAEHFLARACADYGLSRKRLGADARRPSRLRLAGQHPRAGQRHGAGRAPVRGQGGRRRPSTAARRGAHRPPAPTPTVAPAPGEPRPSAHLGVAEDAMRERLAAVLERTGWNISRSAEELGLSRKHRARAHRALGLKPGAEPGARAGACRAAAAPAPPAAPAPGGRPGRLARTGERARAAPILAPPSPPPRPAGPCAGERWRRTFSGDARPRPDAGTLTENTRALETMMDKVRIFGGGVAESADLGGGHLRARSRRGRSAARRDAAMAIDKAVQRARLGRGDPLATESPRHPSAEGAGGPGGPGA